MCLDSICLIYTCLLALFAKLVYHTYYLMKPVDFVGSQGERQKKAADFVGSQEQKQRNAADFVESQGEG